MVHAVFFVQRNWEQAFGLKITTYGFLAANIQHPVFAMWSMGMYMPSAI